jgi:acid phosphatase class B
MVFKETRAQVEKAWTTTKKTLAAMSVWGLIFSLVTIGRLSVAFDYDDTMVDSSKAYEKAAQGATQALSPTYWSALNNAYDLEKPRLIPFTIACVLRALGFRIVILADRQAVDGDSLKKEWRKLAPRGFVFTTAPTNKHLHMMEGHFVAFFGDSDQDMLEAKKAGVLAVRVRRSKRAVATDPYAPGKQGELVIPLSQYF